MKHYTIYTFEAWQHKDIPAVPVGTVDYDPTRNEAVLRQEGKPERYFNGPYAPYAALRWVRQNEYPNSYIEERGAS